MSRLDKLKRLKDEIGRLFHEGLDEIALIDRLRTDEQFADISYEQVQAFYSNLQEESNAEAESKRQIAEKDRQIAERQQILEHLQQNPNNEWQIEEHERLLAREQQIKTQLGFMTKYQQNASKFLIHDEFFDNRIDIKEFLQGRFLMTNERGDETDDAYTIKVQDLFQGVAKIFTVKKIGYLCDIYTLTFPFVFLHEFDNSNHVRHHRLVKCDFENESLQIVQSIEFKRVCQILVSASEASNFLVNKRIDLSECKLIGNQIQTGRRLSLKPRFNISYGSYFDKQLCHLEFDFLQNNQFRNYRLTEVKMLVYNLEQNEHSTYDLDSTPENLSCFHSNNLAWMRDTVFITVTFCLTGKYGVIFTNPQVRNWKFVEFATDLKIDYIQSFAAGTLMVCSEGREEERYKRKIYKLQMRKPDFLRNMAWITMVKLFKEAKVDNPYEEARQYLPLNSEIQPFMITEN